MSSPVPGASELLLCADDIADAVDRAAAQLAPGSSASSASAASALSTQEKEELLVALSVTIERLQGVVLGVLAVSDDVGEAHGARSTATWLAHRLHGDTGAAVRRGRLAHALDRRWRSLGQAVLDGQVSVEQAQVIADGLEALPDTAPLDLVAHAEAHLISEASHFAPKHLRLLARKVWEVVAPDLADDDERRALQRELDAARTITSLTMQVNGDGTTDIRARVPDATGARLRTYLEAFASPRRQATGGDAHPAPRPTRHRLGAAFCELLEHLPAEVLPSHGGLSTSVLVTIDLDSLVSSTGSGDLGSGQRLPAGEIRRLACLGSIIPAILGGPSQVLDLGRTARLFSPAQRKALAVRDKGCRAEGCLIPAAWCEAHHLDPWSLGGRTDLSNGLLLCSLHHHRIHDERYLTVSSPSGTVTFHRRT